MYLHLSYSFSRKLNNTRTGSIIAIVLEAPLHLCNAVYNLAGKLGDRRDRRKRTTAKLERLPRSLLESKRHRSLSNFQPSQLEAYNQSQSTFFGRLPEEIRQIIYNEVFTGHRIHIHPETNRFGHMTCSQKHREICWNQVCALDTYSNFNARYFSREGQFHQYNSQPRTWEIKHSVKKLAKETTMWAAKQLVPVDSFLAFALTCQRAYAIVMHLLYSRNTFNFHIMVNFQMFVKTITPSWLHLIQKLEFTIDFDLADDYWPAHAEQKPNVRNGCKRDPQPFSVWQQTVPIIASMQSLRELRIAFSFLGGFHGDYITWRPSIMGLITHGQLFETLKQIRQVETFEVYVCSPTSEDWNVGQVPFTLVKDDVVMEGKDLTGRQGEGVVERRVWLPGSDIVEIMEFHDPDSDKAVTIWGL